MRKHRRSDSNNETILIKGKEEFDLLESCFQYGNLKEARYVFVGKEEGLDEQNIWENYEGRKSWFNLIPEHIKYIDSSMDMKKGYYIDSSLKAGWIREGKDMEFETFKKMDMSRKKIRVLEAEARIMVLVKEGFHLLDSCNQDLFKSKIHEYYFENLFTPNGETAMFELYGLPRQKNRKFIYENFPERVITPHRQEIIKQIYERFPMNISIIFAGISKKHFIAQEFYEDLGFKFIAKDTSMVNPDYSQQVTPANKPKPFLIGSKENNKQHAIIIPFIGVPGKSNCNKEDLYVIASWIKGLN
jgi:hypothetical protein